MAGRISRFLRLEKPRDEKEAKQPPAPLASPGRFGKAPPTVAPDTAAAPGGALDRFRDPPRMPPHTNHPAEAVPLADAESAEAQPFIRCAVCEADSSRFATHCANCNAPLATADQRMFNDRLWAQRRDEAKALEAELERLKQAGADAEEIARSQRKLGEQLARDVAAAERARLHWMDDGPDAYEEGVGRRETPGLRLLRLIPNTRVRLMVALCLFGVGCWFAWQFFTARGFGGRLVPILYFWLVIMLFVPGARRRRRWWNR